MATSAILAIAASACSTQPMGDANSDIPPRAPIDGPCHADNIDGLIGEVATAGLATRILQRTDARALRWIQPGQAVTMDYRSDRVNVHLDAQNRVERITCG